MITLIIINQTFYFFFEKEKNFQHKRQKSPKDFFAQHQLVGNLIDHTAGTRKKDIIEIFFHADTVWKIQNIPLLNVQDDDQLMWRFSHNGIDTVRSASNNIMEAMLDNDHLKVPGKWNIQAPPKIKHFVWRLLRGCLPTMQRLVQKGIDYVLQNAVSAATTLRMIGTCSLIAQQRAIHTWQAAGLWSLIEPRINTEDGLDDIIFNMLQQLQPAQQSLLSIILWSIWKQRNDKIWNNLDISPTMAVFLARQHQARPTRNLFGLLLRLALSNVTSMQPFSTTPNLLEQASVSEGSMANSSNAKWKLLVAFQTCRG